MGDELGAEDHPMMVWSNSVEELERVSVVADHLDQTGAEELPVTSREIALVFAERLPLIDW
jgi:hypothetical protein